MGLFTVLIGLLMASAAAAAPPAAEPEQEATSFPFVATLGQPHEVRFVVEEEGPVGLYLQLRSGGVYQTTLAGVGQCDGVRWPGGFITGVAFAPGNPPETWDCGVMEAGEHTLAIEAWAGAGVMTAYLSGAHWAETSSP